MEFTDENSPAYGESFKATVLNKLTVALNYFEIDGPASENLREHLYDEVVTLSRQWREPEQVICHLLFRFRFRYVFAFFYSWTFRSGCQQ